MKHLRRDMVREQIEARGIRDARVLKAMRHVPRDAFIPDEMVPHAYSDTALPIASGQTISQPYVVAWMTSLLELHADARVLEIGTGSGYAAAVLAQVAAEVFTVERHASLSASAERVLSELGYDNVRVRCADGTRGWPEQAPFDGIVVAAGGPVVPESLRRQLAVGARLVIPVGESQQTQAMVRVTRTGTDTWESEDLGGVHFVPLIGDEAWPAGT